MSNAKKCDRCKQLYSLPISFVVFDDWWRYSVSKDCHPYPEIRLDLCPECRKKLAEWIRDGEDNG